MITLFITIIILNLIWWLIPKHLKPHEMLFITFFALTFQQVVDIYTDFKYDLYGYFHKGVEWQYLFVLFGIFPAISCIFYNFYPFNRPKSHKITYIITWIAISTAYEHLAIKSNYFYYNNWKLEWSVAMYPLLFIAKLIVFYFYRNLYRNSPQERKCKNS